MLLRNVIFLGLLLAGDAFAQGLSPMRREGMTTSDVKAFFVTVRNPYDRPMTFSLTPVEADLETPAQRAEARPSTVRIGRQRSRRVIVLFEIPQNAEERSVALCVTPTEQFGTIVTRVCGTFTGHRAR